MYVKLAARIVHKKMLAAFVHASESYKCTALAAAERVFARN